MKIDINIPYGSKIVSEETHRENKWGILHRCDYGLASQTSRIARVFSSCFLQSCLLRPRRHRRGPAGSLLPKVTD